MYCSRCHKSKKIDNNNNKTCSKCISRRYIRRYMYFRNLRRQLIGCFGQNFG